MTKWDLSENAEQLNREVVCVKTQNVQFSALEFTGVYFCALPNFLPDNTRTVNIAFGK